MEPTIDLETCKRPEFIEHEANLQGYIKHLEGELEIVNNKLQEYEGVDLLAIEPDIVFNDYFWTPYGKKGNKKTSLRKWSKLTKKAQDVVREHIPKYVKATPDKAFRKNFETYLNQECWNDELPEAAQSFGRSAPVRAATSFIEDRESEDKRLEEAAKLRRASRGRNVKDILK